MNLNSIYDISPDEALSYFSSQNFTSTKNEKGYYEFYKSGEVADLVINCSKNEQIND